MNVEEITNYVKTHDGATIKDNKIHEYSAGYQVASPNNTISVTQKNLESTIRRYLDEFHEFGIWLNPETNLYDIETCFCVNNFEDAQVIGKANNQEAIYDWKNNTNISLKKL